MKKISNIYLPLLFLLYVFIESILKSFDLTICDSNGCTLADNLLKFDSIYLNYLGVIDAILILLFGYLSFKQKINENYFFVVLAASVLFETIMITYQYLVNPEICLFCLGVFSFLIIISIMVSFKRFVFLTPFIIVNIIALSILDIPKNTTFIKDKTYYLIGSSNCVHCKKIKTYFKNNKINYQNIDIKNSETKIFLQFLDISTIPTLVVNSDNIKIINGEDKIITYFENKSKKEQSTQTNLNFNLENLIKKDDEGCGFNTIKLETCE